MTLFQCLLLGFLVVCAISVSFSKNLLNSILIYMSYSLVMSIVWICLESPDLAITEAAVGAGVTSVLFFVTLKKIHAIRQEDEDGSGSEEDIQHMEKPDLQPEGRKTLPGSGEKQERLTKAGEEPEASTEAIEEPEASTEAGEKPETLTGAIEKPETLTEAGKKPEGAEDE